AQSHAGAVADGQILDENREARQADADELRGSAVEHVGARGGKRPIRRLDVASRPRHADTIRITEAQRAAGTQSERASATDHVGPTIERAVVAYRKILAGADGEAVVQSQRRAGVDGEAHVRGVDGARGLRERFVGPGETERESARAGTKKRAARFITGAAQVDGGG